MRRSLVAAWMLAMVGVVAHAADDGAKTATRVYAFKAFLDGKAIGEHRFTVTAAGADRTVASAADFAVTFLGFTAYRYHHRADERWSGECLVRLTASTDDDGKRAIVTLLKAGDGNEIATNAGQRSEPGCLMTWAYWNPALREQTRLLNPQTGQVDPVKVERIGSGRVTMAGQEVAATDWRITGGDSPVDVWVDGQGDWIGLDSTVGKGRHKLTYRLP